MLSNRQSSMDRGVEGHGVAQQLADAPAAPAEGPPMRMRACARMPAELGVPPHRIAYDDF